MRLSLHRRHLSEGQRAAVAAKLANISAGQFAGNQHVPSANLQTPHVSQAEAASMLNVSTRSVAAAAKVQAAGVPELAGPGNDDLFAPRAANMPAIGGHDRLTMSSREIADQVGELHAHVLRDIRSTLSDLGVAEPRFGSSYIDGTGRALALVQVAANPDAGDVVPGSGRVAPGGI